MIFDSDILIWHFRGNEQATRLLSASVPFSISVVTYMELMQGALDKTDMSRMQKFLRITGTTILPITEDISFHAMHCVESYTLSHSMELADALIAATALENRETLYTANDKHYKCIPELSYHVFRP